MRFFLSIIAGSLFSAILASCAIGGVGAKPDSSAEIERDAALKEIAEQKNRYKEVIPKLEKRLEAKNISPVEKEFLTKRLNESRSMYSAYEKAEEIILKGRRDKKAQVLSSLVRELVEKERLIIALTKAAQTSKAPKPSLDAETLEAMRNAKTLYEKGEHKKAVNAYNKLEESGGLEVFTPQALSYYALSLGKTGEIEKAEAIALKILEGQLPPEEYAALKIELGAWQTARQNELAARITVGDLVESMRRAEALLQESMPDMAAIAEQEELKARYLELEKARQEKSLPMGELIRLAEYIVEKIEEPETKALALKFKEEVYAEREEYARERISLAKHIASAERKFQEAVDILDDLYIKVRPAPELENNIEAAREFVFSLQTSVNDEEKREEDIADALAQAAAFYADRQYQEAYRASKDALTRAENAELRNIMVKSADSIVERERKTAAELVKASMSLSEEEKNKKIKEALDILIAARENYPESSLKSKLDMNISALRRQLR